MLHLDSVRRACEHLGIDDTTQKEKLKTKEWARYRLIPSHDTTGQKQEAFMLHLDSVRMACEHLGIDEEGQRQKLKNAERAPWAVACMTKATGPDGKMYEQFMLHLESVPMWLASTWVLMRIANKKN